MDKILAVLGYVICTAIAGFGIYGFVVDVLHGHLGWAIADVLSSGLIAIVRGIGYFFDIIPY